jgi:hypothetical protein
VCNRFKQANALVQGARRRLPEVDHLGVEYQGNPTDDNLLALQEGAKEVVDKLRSALDFCARELYERCNANPPSKYQRIYFPITWSSFNPAEFEHYVEGTKKKPGKIPGLAAARPDLLRLLASFQPFASPENSWIATLSTLANVNKHDRFTVQERVEHSGLVFTNVSIFGEGKFLRTECLTIQGSARVELQGRFDFLADGFTLRGPVTIIGEPPFLDPPGPAVFRLKTMVFTDNVFAMTGESVPWFLRTAIQGIARIVTKLAEIV